MLKQLPKNYDKNTTHASLGFGCEATYKRTNNDYGQTYLADQKISDVPTYSEVVGTQNDFKKMEKLLKNQKVASQYSVIQEMDSIDELQKEKFKFDRNIIVPKNFPVKAETYQYPDPIQKAGNILYRTSNRDYGYKVPQQVEVPQKFFPRDAKYTTSFPDNFRYNGLNTAPTFSKVHKKLDEY